MKLRIVMTCLLLICFAALAVLSGAMPVQAQYTPDAIEAAPVPSSAPESAPSEKPRETPDNTPLPGSTPLPTASVTPDAPEATPSEPLQTPDPQSTPEPQQTPEALPYADVTVIPTTITSDDLIDNDTYYDISADALLAEGPSISLPAEGYQILIIHTHTTEAYCPEGDDVYESSGEYRTVDVSKSVARVGDELASALSAYGLNVLHDAALHDYPSYNGSYNRSGEAIEQYLAAYPGIRIVIDLHRDALGSGDTIYKTVTEAEGEQAAQIMFVMGSDINLEHPNWQENLKLALALQTTVQARYETLMRPTTVCSYRYNQQLTTGSILMEVGTAGNSLQEAITAVKLFADAVGPLLVSWVEAA